MFVYIIYSKGQNKIFVCFLFHWQKNPGDSRSAFHFFFLNSMELSWIRIKKKLGTRNEKFPKFFDRNDFLLDINFGSAGFGPGQSGNRKQTFFFLFWPNRRFTSSISTVMNINII